ncbi:PilZ domain-containing protein [Geoalkalibacter subterraneus]|jgi:uncharacterized protein (TIGR02266 family)|uniref:PilZ domain-containing protein n=1 Tax=Geoalkalibacter subterraneus TaxID=483547 RepID=A0A0B5FJX5_9BACT|nr:PilZ domain-containing protein [Geoalkalibacter subterraneus]AJF07683.1 hypothetical protein GSUB_15565 [Geoalkalibacter subterraneus]
MILCSTPNRQSRLETNAPVRFGRNEQLTQGGVALDLSIGGMYLQSNTLYAAATRLLIEFRLPSCHEPIRCRARVAWCNRAENAPKPSFPPGMGLQFIDLPPIHREAIMAHLNEIESATYH